MNRRAGEKREEVDVDVSGAHLWGIAIPILIGAAGGALAAELLRRFRLKWTWALLGIPPAYLLWFVHWRAGLAASLGTAVALWVAIRFHTEALNHGGEEGGEAREVQGPLGWAWSRLRSRRARTDRVKDGEFALGPSKKGPCRVPLGITRGVHALVNGATGSGKTVTLAAIIEGHVLAGLGAIAVDPKNDAGLRAFLRGLARRTGVRFIEWTPTGPNIYNPLARGGPAEIADKALAAHRWSEPHYEMAFRRLVGQILSTMKAAGVWPPTLSQIVRYSDPECLDDLAVKVGGETAERVSAYVDGLSGRGKADLGGGRDRLAVLVDSELGPWLDPSIGTGEEIDLAASIAGRDIVYFGLDSDRYPAAAQLIASALTIDLVGLSADLQRSGGVGGIVVMDEFAALAADQVSRLFARARSARLSIVLCAQSLADLRGARPEDPSDTLTEQVLSNIEYAIVHRVGDPDSAERFARMAGTTPSWSVTQRVSPKGPLIGMDGPLFGMGEGTRTREREFLIGPDEFKRLRTGEAVVICPSAKRPAQVVRIWPP